MANFDLDYGLRRRDTFRFAAMTALTGWLVPSAFGASDYWNKKQPAEWTDQEKQELLTKSPWAKKINAEFGGGGRGGGGGGRGGGGGGGGESGGGDSEGGGGGGRGGGGGGGGRGGGGGGGPEVAATPTVSLVVAWQSAKPLMEAHPFAFPDKLDQHYVLAVSGIPARALQAAAMGGRGGRGGSGRGQGRGEGRATQEQNPSGENARTPTDPSVALKSGTTLTVKGKPPQPSDIVVATNNNAIVFFGFRKDVLNLTAADKEVDFAIAFGGLSAKAKFNLRDMMYKDELAL